MPMRNSWEETSLCRSLFLVFLFIFVRGVYLSLSPLVPPIPYLLPFFSTLFPCSLNCIPTPFYFFLLIGRRKWAIWNGRPVQAPNTLEMSLYLNLSAFKALLRNKQKEKLNPSTQSLCCASLNQPPCTCSENRTSVRTLRLDHASQVWSQPFYHPVLLKLFPWLIILNWTSKCWHVSGNSLAPSSLLAPLLLLEATGV